LIDDKARLGLEAPYRIAISYIKEINMNRSANHAFAAIAAALLAFGSISAIVIVPPAQAETPAVLALPALA
jgi:hypothetical protein